MLEKYNLLIPIKDIMDKVQSGGINKEMAKTEITKIFLEAKDRMSREKFLILCGPSGSGKSTLVKHILENNSRFSLSISCTTRQPRDGEEDGSDYYFLTPEEFRSKLENEAFAEYEEVYEDVYYGTLKSEIQRIIDLEKKIPIFDIDYKGAKSLKKVYPKAITIFIDPPSMEVLEERLRSRASDSEESIQKRIARAREEIDQKSEFDYFLVNNEWYDTIQNLDKILIENEVLLPEHSLTRGLLGANNPESESENASTAGSSSSSADISPNSSVNTSNSISNSDFGTNSSEAVKDLAEGFQSAETVKNSPKYIYRITKKSGKDNWWGLPYKGPCGPCSEIYYLLDKNPTDFQDSVLPYMKPEEVEDWLDENVVEIGNIVFMQYTGEKDVSKEPINLEKGSKNIDFGMGFERLLAIMQNKENVQDTDVLKPISDVVEKWQNKAKE